MRPEQKKEFLRLVVERIWVDSSNNLEIQVIIPKLEEKPENGICETVFSLIKERGIQGVRLNIIDLGLYRLVTLS